MMNMAKQVKLGIVGLGPRGKSSMKLFNKHPNCNIVALCDISRGNLDSSAAELDNSDVKCYTDYEQMISAELLDAIFIAADPDIQVDMACYAMEKGIHVATEVPAAFTIKQCWDLVNTVKKTGVKYFLSEQARYFGFIQEWREMAQRGEFGKILLAEGEYLHCLGRDYYINPKTGEATWRQKTALNPIYYLPHTLSPLLSITDDRITRVSCMGTKPQSYYMENLAARDIQVANMHTSNDTILKVSAGFTSPHGPRKETAFHWYQVKGSQRTVEWCRTNHDKPKMWSVGDGDWQNMDWSLVVEGASDFIKHSGHGGTDGWPIDHFLKAIVEDTDVEMDVYKAVETAAPAIMAVESSNEGGTLKEVPDFRERK
jgi:predicted dehydrogenase